LGPLLIAQIGPGHSPVGHGAVGVDDGGLTERALGLHVPKTVKLTQSLVEESLALGIFGGHGKVYLGHTLHEVGLLARPLVERFSMCGMPGGHGCVVVLFFSDKRRDKQRGQDGNQPCGE